MVTLFSQTKNRMCIMRQDFWNLDPHRKMTYRYWIQEPCGRREYHLLFFFNFLSFFLRKNFDSGAVCLCHSLPSFTLCSHPFQVLRPSAPVRFPKVPQWGDLHCLFLPENSIFLLPVHVISTQVRKVQDGWSNSHLNVNVWQAKVRRKKKRLGCF